jgi:hypothetical protein
MAFVHDSKTLRLIPIEHGSYYFIDKGYVDFNQLLNHFIAVASLGYKKFHHQANGP